jgi:2-iminobutanoate/2-iminopropanoate deaminase
MKDIYTPKAPEPIGPYSQGKEAAGLVFLSGQIAIDPGAGAFMDGDISGQTDRVCLNIESVLKAAGLTFQNVIKTTCFLTDEKDFRQFNDTYARHFISCPARSCVFVWGLAKNALVEIEAIAAKDA